MPTVCLQPHTSHIRTHPYIPQDHTIHAAFNLRLSRFKNAEAAAKVLTGAVGLVRKEMTDRPKRDKMAYATKLQVPLSVRLRSSMFSCCTTRDKSRSLRLFSCVSNAMRRAFMQHANADVTTIAIFAGM
jgi:hypothetical protein